MQAMHKGTESRAGFFVSSLVGSFAQAQAHSVWRAASGLEQSRRVRPASGTHSSGARPAHTKLCCLSLCPTRPAESGHKNNNNNKNKDELPVQRNI